MGDLIVLVRDISMTPARTLFYCAIGTMLEWYDFAIFGALSPTLSKIFFPNENKLIALMLSFAIFATGFIMRPLGGILLGHIGDRYGRKKAIIISVLLMTVATASIGLLPVQSSTTMMAMLLLVLRLLQGVSVGGEYPGIITFSGELGAGGQFFSYLSLIAMTSNGGILLGTIVGAVFMSFHHPDMWRLPFLISIFLGLIGFYLRAKACESPLFSQVKNENKLSTLPIKQAITQFYKQILWVMLMFAGGSISFYFAFIYYPSVVHHYDYHHSGHYLVVNITSLSLGILLMLFTGQLVNKNNYKIVISICLLGMMILPAPMLYLVSQDIQLALPAQVVYVLFLAPYSAIYMAAAFFVFPSQVRYTCIAIILSLTAGVFGGTYPLIATFLVRLTHHIYIPGIYLSAMLVLSLYIFLRNQGAMHLVD